MLIFKLIGCILKLILKILLLPFALVCVVLSALVNIISALGSMALGFLMFLLIVAMIITGLTHLWQQTGIAFAAICCVAALTLIIRIFKGTVNGIADFMVGLLMA